MTDIRVIVPEDLKSGAEKVFKSMDMNMSQAIRLFLRQVVVQKALPFNPYERHFNEETVAAMKRTQNPDNLIRYDDSETALEEWDKL